MINTTEYVEGYAEENSALYCPKCGRKIGTWHGAFGHCSACRMDFAVLVEEEDGYLSEDEED